MFIFTLLCGALKGFETPQKSVKMKIQLIFLFLRDRDGKG